MKIFDIFISTKQNTLFWNSFGDILGGYASHLYPCPFYCLFKSYFRYLSGMLAQNAEYLSLPASPLSHGHIQQEYKHYVGGKCKRNVFLELKSLIACHTNDVVLKAFISFAHLHFLMLQCGGVKRHLAPY